MCHLEYGLFGVCICLLLSDSETPWTAARQAPLLWDSPGKNAGVGCHVLLQGIFPTQESNLSPLHCRQILYRLSQDTQEVLN